MNDYDISGDTWQRLNEAIEENNTFTIMTHVNPDGDAAGSSFAVYEFLRQRGKEVRLISSNNLPDVYSFLHNADTIYTEYSPAHDDWIRDCDVIFLLDMALLDRLVYMKPVVMDSRAFRICIDHHQGSHDFADIAVASTDACATAELVHLMFKKLNGTITKEIAEYLYTGILTDTESFSNRHTSRNAHLAAAELMEYGIDTAEIDRIIYKGFSWERVNLLKRALATLTSECGGRLAWIKIDGGMVTKSGARREEIDGFVDFPMSIAGVEVSILFLEVPGRGTKISIRSYGTVNVNELAAEFGGGGHKHAAGIRLFETGLDAAADGVLRAARKLFDES